MSEVLNTRILKVLCNKSGAPKWVTESGGGGENNGMHVVVGKGQAVRWKTKGEQKFTIRFVNPATGTPFSDWSTQARESSGGNNNILEGTVSESDDTDVVYKYNVEVAGHDALDPAIIMDK